MLKNNVQKDWQGLMRSIRRCLACMHRSPSRQSLHKLVMILSKVDWWIVHKLWIGILCTNCGSLHKLVMILMILSKVDWWIVHKL